MTRQVILIALLLLASGSIVLAQNAHVLEGKVIAPDGTQPRNPVRVRLTFSGRPIHETFTDLSGRFTFPGLARGTYQLTAEGDGLTFQTTSTAAEVSAFGSAPQSFSQDIQLRPLPYEASKAGVVNAFTQAVPPAAKQSFERAQKLNEKGDTEEAVKNLQSAIKLFPEYFDAHLQLGNIFLKQDRLNEAIAELDLARQVNPNDERAYQSFGLVLMKQKNYAMAVAVFAEAARLNPANPMNAMMRGTALIHQASRVAAANSDQPNEDRDFLIRRAEVALNQAANLSGNQLKPDSLTLVMFYEMKGELVKAANELEAFLKKLPENESTAPLRGELKRLRDKSRAEKSSTRQD